MFDELDPHPLLTHSYLLHPRTGQPLQPVGVVNGKPVWPIIGAADDDEDEDKKDDEDEDKKDDEDDADKDDDSTDWKAKFEAQQKINRDLEKKNRRSINDVRKQVRADVEKELAGKKDDKDELDADEIRKQAREEAAAEALRDRISDKIEAKAKDFADPEDAVAILLRNNDVEDFADDGKVDVDAIVEALKDLAEKKPNLLAKGKRFEGGGDGGARSTKPERPKSLGDAVGKHYAGKK